MASRALTARLTITCSNCDRSAFTGHRSRPKAVASVTFSPISRRSSMVRSLSVSLRSSTCGRSVCLREKASSWRTSAAPRLAFCLICMMSWKRGIGRLVRVEQEIGRHHDGGEHVVEVVRDAAGELADRLHLLLLVDAVLQVALRGGLQRVDDGRLAVAVLVLDRRTKKRGPAFALAGERGFDRRNIALPRRAALRDRRSRAPAGRARRRPKGSSARRP